MVTYCLGKPGAGESTENFFRNYLADSEIRQKDVDIPPDFFLNRAHFLARMEDALTDLLIRLSFEPGPKKVPLAFGGAAFAVTFDGRPREIRRQAICDFPRMPARRGDRIRFTALNWNYQPHMHSRLATTQTRAP